MTQILKIAETLALLAVLSLLMQAMESLTLAGAGKFMLGVIIAGFGMFIMGLIWDTEESDNAGNIKIVRSE